MKAEDMAALDKEARDRIVALEAEVAEQRAENERLRGIIAQMERDQPTLEVLARTVQAQKNAHRAEVEKLKAAKADGR